MRWSTVIAVTSAEIVVVSLVHASSTASATPTTVTSTMTPAPNVLGRVVHGVALLVAPRHHGRVGKGHIVGGSSGVNVSGLRKGVPLTRRSSGGRTPRPLVRENLYARGVPLEGHVRVVRGLHKHPVLFEKEEYESTRALQVYSVISKSLSWLEITYIDSGRLPLDHCGLKENIFVHKSKVVVQLGHGSCENTLRRLAGSLEGGRR